MKWAGKAKLGFAIIPKTLVTIDEDDEYLYYSDGNSIYISLKATVEADSDPESYMGLYIGRMEGLGAIVTGPTKMPLNGIDTLQVLGHFPDEDISFAAWVFQTDDGMMHRVTGEGSSYEINDVVEYLETTYTLELPAGAVMEQSGTQKPPASEKQQAGSAEVCRAANCQNKKTGSSSYCAEHKCVESGCNNGKSWKTSSAYCNSHKCLVSTCGNRKISNSISYCSAHNCAEPNCRSECTYGNYCYAHRK